MVKAAVLHAYGSPLAIEDIRLGEPSSHEVIVRTAAVGLCHSDLHYIDGMLPQPLPLIPGHEVAGVVDRVGKEVTRFAPGDHVIGCLSVFCGRCSYCVTGQLVLCSDADVKMPTGKAKRLFSSSGGSLNQAFNLSAFSECILVHENALVKIRKDMPLDRAALIGCSVLTGTGAVFRAARMEPGSTVAIIGCGGVGLSCVMGAALAGASRIIAIDRIPEKLDMAGSLGATDVIDNAATDPLDQVKMLVPEGVDYAFECIGLKQTAEQAFAMLAPGGTATLMGLMAADVKLSLPGRDFLRQRRVQGTLMGSNRFPLDIPRLVDLYMQGRLPLDALISQRLPLERINDGLADLRSGKLARSVVVFPGVGNIQV